MSMSLDGYIAGPNDEPGNPGGDGFGRLHEWDHQCGATAAGVVAPPQAFQVEAKGFHLLQDIFRQPYQNVGVVARRSRLDELAPALRPLLASIRDHINAWNAK